MVISEQQGITQSDIFDNWAERVDTARTAKKKLLQILPEGETKIKDLPVEVTRKNGYFCLIIDGKDLNSWPESFHETYGEECLAWEMAKTYALTEGTFRR